MNGRRWRWVGVVAALAVGVVLWLLLQHGSTDWLPRERLESWLLALGAWGPVALVAVEALQVLLAPVPGNVVGLAAGYLYGVWVGAALCTLGLMLGTGLTVWLVRRLGRPLVARMVRADRLQRLEEYAQRRGARALLLVFLVPLLPDDAACLIAGLTTIPIRLVLLVALIGRTPGVIASTLIGAQARALSTVQIVAIGAASLLMVGLFWVFQERLEALAFRLTDRLLGKRAERV